VIHGGWKLNDIYILILRVVRAAKKGIIWFHAADQRLFGAWSFDPVQVRLG
jgi:hypothetical protein